MKASSILRYRSRNASERKAETLEDVIKASCGVQCRAIFREDGVFLAITSQPGQNYADWLLARSEAKKAGYDVKQEI